MSLESKINQVLLNPKTDWNNSIFNRTMIMRDYFKFKVGKNEEFKEKTLNWLNQAIINNQENLICFLASFAPLDEKILGMSYAYNSKETFKHLMSEHYDQNNPHPYKISLHTLNEGQINYYKVLHCIETNQFDMAKKFINEKLIYQQGNQAIALLLDKSLEKPEFFNALIKAMQENDTEAKFDTDEFDSNIFVNKVIGNDLLTKDYHSFFSNLLNYLNEETKDKLLDYLLTKNINYAVLLDFNGDFILNNQTRLEKVMNHYKFDDDDCRHIIERFMSNVDFSLVGAKLAYSKIKEHSPTKEKTILMAAISFERAELIEEILLKNNFNFQDSNFEILKAFAKQDSPYFDKIMNLLITEKEVNHLEKALEVKEEKNTKKMKL